jgi:hypothetical protein
MTMITSNITFASECYDIIVRYDGALIPHSNEAIKFLAKVFDLIGDRELSSGDIQLILALAKRQGFKVYQNEFMPSPQD